MRLEEVESKLGYTFKDKTLLKRALTLASASDDNNQLLEFFGDAILEFIVSERIFNENSTEGALTEKRKTLVSDSALAPVSKKLGLDKFLIRGKKDNFNKKAIPSAYEAAVAAIYLDGGMDEAKKFVLATMDFSKKSTQTDYKSKLQIALQSMGEPLPQYVSEEVGMPQNKRYVVSVNAFGQSFKAEADKIKGADGGEQLCAKAALNYYENNK